MHNFGAIHPEEKETLTKAEGQIKNRAAEGSPAPYPANLFDLCSETRIESLRNSSALHINKGSYVMKKIVPVLSAIFLFGFGLYGYAKTASAQMQQMFQRAVKIGVKVAFGTDSAVEPHGLDAREFALMVKGGMTPAQALLAATASGANLLGLADQIGTLEPGKLADLVAVPGDPLQDIRQTEKVSFVMQEGKVIKNLAAGQR